MPSGVSDPEARVGKGSSGGDGNIDAPFGEGFQGEGGIVRRLEVLGVGIRIGDLVVGKAVGIAIVVVEHDEGIAPVVVEFSSSVDLTIDDFVLSFITVVQAQGVEAAEFVPAFDTVVAAVLEGVFESDDDRFNREETDSLSIDSERLIVVIEIGECFPILGFVGVCGFDEVSQGGEGCQGVGIDSSQVVGVSGDVGESSGEETHSFFEQFAIPFGIFSAEVEGVEEGAIQEIRLDDISALGGDLRQEGMDVQEGVIILEGKDPDTGLEGIRGEGKSVALYGEESQGFIPVPALQDITGIEGGFAVDFEFIEHAFGGGLHPIFAGSDDIQVVPTRAVRIFFPFGQHGGSFHNDTTLLFDASGMWGLVESLRGEDLSGIAHDGSISGGDRQFQGFAVTGSAGFDLRDRGDGEGDSDALRGIGFGFSVIDEAFHGLEVLVKGFQAGGDTELESGELISAGHDLLGKDFDRDEFGSVIDPYFG